jgi:hypothetical protein
MAGPRITCLDCGDIIRSTHRHDWRPCSCFKNEEGSQGCFIDGGEDYIRVGGDNWKFTADPCPFCGDSSDLELNMDTIRYAIVDGKTISQPGVFVECGNCGAHGPVTLEVGEPEQFYWDEWNLRGAIGRGEVE